MKNVSDKRCRENQNTFHVQYFIYLFFSENCAGYETMWNNMTARRATDDKYNRAHALRMLDPHTHSEYVILIAFPRQEW
jgi:hypothetical protein